MKHRIFYFFLFLVLVSFNSILAQGRLEAIREKLFNPFDPSVLVASHRGDWRNACENSLEAIENAINMGVDIIEIDLARTKDGQLILMHDDKVDRTTTGKGWVKDLTLEEIKGLRLRNGCAIKTIYKVPTLEEALMAAKGRVMLNLDKAFDYFDQVYELLEKTGTTDLVIMKSNVPAEEVKRSYGQYLDKVVFMPKVDLDDPLAMMKLNDYLRILNPVAIEFKFAHNTNRLPFEVKNKMAGKSRIWYNTLWDTHAGGHDDDCSLQNPDEGYGYLIDELGATILQTDRPQYLIDYLKHHQTMDKKISDWSYLSDDNEFQVPANTGNMKVIESFLKGKKNAQENEDGIFINSHFAAVIDGATSKSDFQKDGKSSGKWAMELVIEAIKDFPKNITAAEAVKRITRKLHDFYVENNMLEDLKEHSERRLTANGVIYSCGRKEIWQIGDCQLKAGAIYSSGEKEIDRIMSEARVAYNEVMLLKGLSEEEIAENDPGRAFIKPFLEKQALLQNNPNPNLQYAFPVFDGFDIPTEWIKVFYVSNANEIILSSDGYPMLLNSLKESEQYLHSIMEKDPQCMRLYKTTKGIQKGNCSFDDRAYLRICIE